MTRKDAIKQLRSLQDEARSYAESCHRDGEYNTVWDEDVEALDLAISALTLMMSTSTVKLSELPNNALLLIKNADNSVITIVPKGGMPVVYHSETAIPLSNKEIYNGCSFYCDGKFVEIDM